MIVGVARASSVAAKKQHQSFPSGSRLLDPLSKYLRRLQGDECVVIGIDFVFEVLGPSLAEDSLFWNVEYPGGIAFDEEGEPLKVDLSQLTLETLYPLYINPATPTFVQEDQYFGHNGEYTVELLNQHTLLKEFWKTDERGPPILLIGLHSERLGDLLPEAVEESFLTEGYDPFVWTKAESTQVVQEIRTAIEEELPQQYANPFLTFEAFTAGLPITGFEDSTTIVIGDGYLDYDEWLGLGEIGNDITHAHEFAHAIQYIIDLEDAGGDPDQYELNTRDYDTAEGSRRLELEADAMAGYALAHERGRNFEVPLLVQVSRESFSSGDCEVEDPSHHGTPLQRECATLWGADEGLDMTGEPISIREFRALFLENYERILALDPAVCKLSEPTDVPVEAPIPDLFLFPTQSPAVEAAIPDPIISPTATPSESLTPSTSPSPFPSPLYGTTFAISPIFVPSSSNSTPSPFPTITEAPIPLIITPSMYVPTSVKPNPTLSPVVTNETEELTESSMKSPKATENAPTEDPSDDDASSSGSTRAAASRLVAVVVVPTLLAMLSR